jgi:hypothetical protein
VHGALLATTSPRYVIRWLTLSEVTSLLGNLAAGEEPVTFATLDALPRSRAVWFVEHLLTAAGSLPGRDPVLARFELWVAAWLDAIEVADSERVLRRFATWEVLRPLREASARRWLSDTTHNGAKTRLRAARDLLMWIEERTGAPESCRQGDLDAWVVARTRSTVRAARPFWRWAVRHRFVPAALTSPHPADAPPGAAPAGAQHWELARWLLHGDDLEPADRVAGLFVVLYAQPLSRIVRMTADDVRVDPAGVAVRFGRTPIAAPEPLAGHIRSLLEPRVVTTAAKVPGPAAWLFPGLHPGRPLHAVALGKRLTRLGVPVGSTRVAALAHLAAEMPPAVVSDMLGIHASTAAMWSRAAGRTWADYAAHRSPGAAGR